MRIVHSLINPAAWNITSGAWIDSTGLTDRSPATTALFTWPAGTQTTSTTVILDAQFDAQAIGGLAILGTDLPVGTLVQVSGKRQGDAGFTYALGGNSAGQRVVQMPDGSRAVFFLFSAGLDPLIGVQITIYNDVSGAVAIAAGQQITIGEIAAGTVVAIDHDKGAQLRIVDPSKDGRTLAAQDNRVQRKGYRAWKAKPTYGTRDDAVGGTLTGAPDWQTLQAKLQADPYVVLTIYADTADRIQQTSIFGRVTQFPDLESLAGPYYGPSEIAVEEIPA